jgi:hypothetical protein
VARGHAAYIIERMVTKAYGVTARWLKAHGHVAVKASAMALERAARLPGWTPRAMGHYFGGIRSSALAMMRQKIRTGGSGLQARLEVLQGRLES